MDPTVGDFAGNARRILDWIAEAERQNADLIVFPELVLSGYPVWDLANKKSFVAEGTRCLARIAAATARKKIAAAVGYIHPGEPGADTRSYNALAWIEKGKVRSVQYKRLLPTYDVFLEEIFFRQGKASRVFAWKGQRVGLTICEDLWDGRYDEKPLDDLARKGASLVINISASPFYRGVAKIRDEVVSSHARKYRFHLLYVNQTGAQDDLIFDGRSLFSDGRGRILFRAPAFREGLFYYDWEPEGRQAAQVVQDPLAGQPGEIYEALVVGIRDYCRKNGFKKVLLGLSGGIDSALVATLAADALGPESVLGVTMPGAYSSPGSWQDSETLAANLGIEFRTRPIRGKYEYYLKEAGRDPGKISLAMENLQARLRGLELMFISNDEGRLLLSTGNKSELAMGYCTLYGDMAGGLCVLGDVYKTDVYRLARYRNAASRVIPEPTLEKPPSAELRPDQKDQDSLPPYEVLDRILYLYIEQNRSQEEIIRELKKEGIGAQTVAEVVRKVDHNEYKRRQTPPILRVTQKAWFGRRMPITNRFLR